jgi:adenosine kinase
LNLSAPFICQFFLKPMLEVLPYVDYLFGNETEAAAFAQAMELGLDDTTKIAQHMANLPKNGAPRTVIITNGSDPTIVATSTTMQQFAVEKIPLEELVDTNGAGDAFAGGFLSQLVQNMPLSNAISAGHYTAGVIVRRSGINFPDHAPSL